MLTYLKNRLKAFRDETKGVVAVEAVIMIPVLFWGYMAMFTYFDAYRQASINSKAGYTIADLMSRETDAITPVYLDNAYKLFEYLTRSPKPGALRVSVIAWDENFNFYRFKWSQTRGNVEPLTVSEVRRWDRKLPVMPHNETVIVVETWSTYYAPFKIGLNDRVIDTFTFTRPRFATQLCWDGPCD